MGAAVWTYKAVDGAGVPSKGELKGTSKDAVTEQLQRPGPEGHGAARRRSRVLQADLTPSAASRPPS